MDFGSFIEAGINKSENKCYLTFRDNFSKCQNDVERSNLFCESVLCSKILLPLCNDVLSSKNDQLAEKFRREGNQLFKKEKWIEAAKVYTKSLCYAIDDAKAALSFSNRSAALVKLNCKDCLKDIERAISCGYYQDLRFKLEERKAHFYSKVNEKELASKSFEEAIKYVRMSNLSKNKIKSLINDYKQQSSKCTNTACVDDSLEELLLYDKEIPELKERHPIFTSMSKYCEVKYSEEKGRHVVALKDFKPGEVLLLEEPYSKSIHLEEMWQYCYYCHRHCLSGLPCSKCPFIIYCSETCQNKGLEDHKIDCQMLKYLVNSDLQRCPILAVKTVSKIPAKEINNFSQEKIQDEFDEVRKVVTRGGKYEWNNYKGICDLVTNGSKRSTKDLILRGFKALYLLRVLETTTYFNDVSSDSLNATKVQVFSLLLNHLQSFPSNSHTITEFAIDPSSLLQSTSQEVGCGIFATLSLFSHSCNPNATRNNHHGAIVMRSTAPIREGEEIFDNYGHLYQLSTKEERVEAILDQYKFGCACVACVHNWPTLFSLPHAPKWICQKCLLPLESTASGELCCDRCSMVEEIGGRKGELMKKEKKFQISHNLLLKWYPVLSLPGVIEYVDYLYNNLQQPWGEFARAVETLKQAFDLMGNCRLLYK